MSEGRTFVGFGFGPIQVGLYLHEAMRTGAFDRLVVAYRRPDVVERVRTAGGRLWLNVAHLDGIEHVGVGEIEIYDVGTPADREHIVAALADASEACTALSSVDDYANDAPGSVHRLLARGLARRASSGERAVVYASENHTRAAELLAKTVASALEPADREAVADHVAFVDTVIGKMSRTVTHADEIAALGLRTRTDADDEAYLVESYREVLAARAEGFDRALTCFADKHDLEPFEEAKLYGHNATHALAAYLGRELGAAHIAEVADLPGFMPFLRGAAIEESGAALVRRHRGKDDMFDPGRFEAFTDRLIGRMLNPWLNDTVDRVGRDPLRKLGWTDRLIGTMRLALGEGIEPHRHALGTAAAMATSGVGVSEVAESWRAAGAPAGELGEVVGRVAHAHAQLERWREEGQPPLEPFVTGAATT